MWTFSPGNRYPATLCRCTTTVVSDAEPNSRCAGRSTMKRSLCALPPVGLKTVNRLGEGPVKRVFTGVGIAFKGSGFYKNDYGANAQSRKAGSDQSKTGESRPDGEPSKSLPSSDDGASDSTKDKAKTNTSGKAKAGVGSSLE